MPLRPLVSLSLVGTRVRCYLAVQLLNSICIIIVHLFLSSSNQEYNTHTIYNNMHHIQVYMFNIHMHMVDLLSICIDPLYINNVTLQPAHSIQLQHLQLHYSTSHHHNLHIHSFLSQCTCHVEHPRQIGIHSHVSYNMHQHS